MLKNPGVKHFRKRSRLTGFYPVAATGPRYRSWRGEVSFVGVAFFFLLFLCGCHRPTGPSEADLNKKFPLAEETSSASGASPDLDVYVDDSGSMRGFVKTPHSIYRQVLRSILLSSTNAQLHVSVYPLSSDRSVTSEPFTAIQSESFYTGRDTPLAALLRKIAARPSHTAIVLTDLVQSERGTDNQMLQAALTDLASHKLELRLLAFRSDFAGEYFPEIGTGPKRMDVRVSQAVPHAGRPFYLLVVAPNTSSMNKADNDILAGLPKLYAFDPSEAPFEISGIKLSKQPEPRKSWAIYTGFKVLVRPARRVESGYTFGRTADAADVVDLPVTLSLHTKLPMHRAERVELMGEIAEWSGSFQSSATTLIPVHGELHQEKGGTTMPIVLTVRRPKPTTWDIYRIRVRAGEGNLDVPDWVNEWSTEDDSIVEDANKTFQLSSFVQTLERVISERKTCGEWLLKIHGGDK